MSVNVYLNNNVCELPGFKSRPYKEKPDQQEKTYKGEHVFESHGRLYFMSSLDGVIPDELKDVVEEISCHEFIPQMGRRESGIYRHESAECELMPSDQVNSRHEKPIYSLKITGKKMEDIRAVLVMVKTGTIRPAVSYEGSQEGKTRAQLEAELSRSEGMLGKAVSVICELANNQVLVSQLAKRIKNGSRWPLITRSKVASQILAILEAS